MISTRRLSAAERKSFHRDEIFRLMETLEERAGLYGRTFKTTRARVQYYVEKLVEAGVSEAQAEEQARATLEVFREEAGAIPLGRWRA